MLGTHSSSTEILHWAAGLAKKKSHITWSGCEQGRGVSEEGSRRQYVYAFLTDSFHGTWIGGVIISNQLLPGH